MAKGITIKLDNPAATAAKLKRAFHAALPKASEQMISDCNTYVRMKDGPLANSAHPENGGRQLVWQTPYAKKVYYTGTPWKGRNPLASLRWCEKAKRRYGRQWGAQITKLINGGG